MRTRKTIALILLLAMAAAVLSGCHGTMDQNAAKEGYISEIPLYLDETKTGCTRITGGFSTT